MAIPKDIVEILSSTGFTKYDAVFIGDGSGSKYGQAGGWACKIYDYNSIVSHTLYGNISDTTINICELTPYIYTMDYYHKNIAPVRWQQLKLAGTPFGPIRIHIITDCEILVKQGNGLHKRKTNAAFWSCFDYYETEGYNFCWHFVEREFLQDNILCDKISKDMRKMVKNYNVADTETNI